jgi:tRNA threonylcarbamoyladenosine biosynthesis protein TsaE
VRLLSNSDEETKRIGLRLGERLKPGDVICLYGELGAGKTTMIKGIAKALGIEEREISSASFVIIAEHTGRLPLYHVDLYRISPHEVHDLGLHEYLGGEGVTVIEWAEKAETELSGDRINVRIYHENEDTRSIDIEGIEI